MAEPNARAGSATRKIKWLAIGIVVAVGLYAALWAFLASRLDATAANAIARAQAEGTSIECAERDVRGFPFRLGLRCERTAVTLSDGTRAQAGEFRSAAQVYDPGLVISELDGPLALETTAGGGQLDWTNARASTQFGLERLNLGTVRIEDATFDGVIDGSNVRAAIGRLLVSVRPNGPDLDAALTIDGFDAEPVGGRDAPPMDLRVDATVSGAAGAVAFQSVPIESLRGRTVTLRALDLALRGGGRLAANGEVAVDGEGLPTGSIEVGFSDLAGMAEAVAAVAPEYGGPLRTVAGVLDGGGSGGFLSGLLGGGASNAGASASAQADEEGEIEADDGLTRATIALDRGEARLGVIPLGRVPPLP